MCWCLANGCTLSKFSLALLKIASVMRTIHLIAVSLKIHSICAVNSNFHFHLNYCFSRAWFLSRAVFSRLSLILLCSDTLLGRTLAQFPACGSMWPQVSVSPSRNWKSPVSPPVSSSALNFAPWCQSWKMLSTNKWRWCYDAFVFPLLITAIYLLIRVSD